MSGKREDVAFYSEGYRLSGHLYLPEKIGEDEKMAGVVLAHGFTGIKELILPDVAARFARQGLAALTFDYRGFGTSEGQRGRLLAPEQVVDIRNAVTFLGTRTEVNAERIGLWGTSYGCGLAIYAAAFDHRVKATVAQIGIADGPSSVANVMAPEQLAQMKEAIEQDRIQRVSTGRGMYIDPFSVIPDSELVSFFQDALPSLPHLKTDILLQFVEAHLEFSPISVVDRISPRALLVIAAEKDALCPPAELRRLYDRAGEPKRFRVVEGCTHFECYSGAGLREIVSEAVSWYKEHV